MPVFRLVAKDWNKLLTKAAATCYFDYDERQRITRDRRQSGAWLEPTRLSDSDDQTPEGGPGFYYLVTSWSEAENQVQVAPSRSVHRSDQPETGKAGSKGSVDNESGEPIPDAKVTAYERFTGAAQALLGEEDHHRRGRPVSLQDSE
jgi:hypothetical protein